eukprot:11224284-Lingulodinium_polyedra.AAC.1
MLAVATILSKDSLLQWARMVTLFCGPVYDAHSSHAAGVRSPAETLEFYCSAAKGTWLQHLSRVADLLLDMPALTHLGFTTDFANLPKRAK